MTFDAKSKLKRVGDNVFQGCAALSKVYFGTVENTLPSSLVEAGTSMFSGCKTIQTFRIPKGLKYISSSMFQHCTALNKVTFESGCVCKWIGISAFEGCTSLIDFVVADSVIGLGSAAFKDCTKLENCVLPDGLLYLSTYKNDGYKNYVDTPSAEPFTGINRLDKSDDNSYKGDTDEWKLPVVATRDVIIPKGTRICQFRIQLSQKATFWQKLKWFFSSIPKLQQVASLNNQSRGGFGSTGNN